MKITHNDTFYTEFVDSGYIVLRANESETQILFICHDIIDADIFVGERNGLNDGWNYWFSEETAIK